MTTPDAQVKRKRTWIVPVVFLLGLIAALLLDDSIDRWIIATRSPALEIIAKTCSWFLAWHWLMLGAVVAFLFAWWRQRRDWMRVLCVMMVAASLAGLSADFLRGITGRTRPSAAVAQGWYGMRSNTKWLVFQHAYNSFPSGHTSAAAGFALPLFFWRRRFAPAALSFIFVVASARVWAGAHHLSDVIAGAALGTLIAFLVWRRSDAGERLLNAVPRWQERA